MPSAPIHVVGTWLQNLLDDEVVHDLVAPDATYVSLNTDDAELAKIMPWAGTSKGPQAFLDNLGLMFAQWENMSGSRTPPGSDRLSQPSAALNYIANRGARSRLHKDCSAPRCAGSRAARSGSRTASIAPGS